VPAIERGRGAEDRLLAGILQGRIERRLRLAVQHQGAGRVDIGKVGAERAAAGVVEAVCGGSEIGEAGGIGDQ
jgi:hypothetical protein